MKKDFNNNSELIDAYLEGELSASQAQDFEARLEKDPLLKHELQRREELIEGIRQFRHAQLKSQLSEVNISLAKIKLIKTLKISGIIAAASLTGLAVYFFWNDKSAHTPLPVEKVEVSVPHKETPADKEPSMLEMPVTEKKADNQPNELTKKANPDIEESEEAHRETLTEKNTLQKEIPAEPLTIKKEQPKVEFKAPQVKVPVVADHFEDQFNTSLGNQAELEGDLLGRQPAESKRFDINTQHSKEYDFHYQFKGNSLVLFGDFSKDTYEILEIIEQDIRKVYLYYQGDFYALENKEQEILPLTPIENQKLINTLYSIRKEKTL
jgi:hypothetical protein